MRYSIRLATKDDDEEIAKLSVAVWQDSYKNIFSDDFLMNLRWESRATERKNFFEDHRKASYVSTVEQKITGFCDIGPANHSEATNSIKRPLGEIYAMYLLPAYQNRHIGTSLYQHADNHLKKYDFQSTIVWTLAENKRAINFFPAWVVVQQYKKILRLTVACTRRWD